MKSFAIPFGSLPAALLLAGIAGWSSLANAGNVPSADAADTNVVQSVFVLPDNPNEGRDPFFPDSMRPYPKPTQPRGEIAFSDIKLEGISRAGSSVFVVINDVTFGVGDEADVKTAHGRKVHVLCKQIEGDSAVVEVGGQILTLTLPNP
ncbi:MAG TPA: hypothetical protein VMV89_04910 [Candidatus Paceibacterota bacterium]|nr:hypothetical protein [Candidatus Paceibacterota bacterium]